MLAFVCIFCTLLQYTRANQELVDSDVRLTRGNTSDGLTKNSQGESRYLTQQLAGCSQPLTDHGEASAISRERCSGVELLCTNSSTAAASAGAGTNVLSHFDFRIVGESSVAQQSLGLPVTTASSSRGTYVLSHYTEYSVLDQKLVGGAARDSSVAVRRLSHHPDSLPALPTSESYSSLGPPPLEHLPNYCSLTVSNFNLSSNNSTGSLPPPPLMSATNSPRIESPSARLSGHQSTAVQPHVRNGSVLTGRDMEAHIPVAPPPLRVVPVTTPKLLKLEAPSSPLRQLDSDTALTVTNHIPPTTSHFSAGSTSTTQSSPPPLTHSLPILSADDITVAASCSSGVVYQAATQTPSPIVLYGPPPQGIL